jgi:hypothetical protein
MLCLCVFNRNCTRSFGRPNKEECKRDGDENSAGSRTAPQVRVAQRDFRGIGRLVADCLEARQGSPCVGCRGQEIRRSDGSVWRGRRRSCQPGSGEGRPAPDVQAPPRHGRRSPARAESQTGKGTQQINLRAMDGNRIQSPRSKIQSLEPASARKGHFL